MASVAFPVFANSASRPNLLHLFIAFLAKNTVCEILHMIDRLTGVVPSVMRSRLIAGSAVSSTDVVLVRRSWLGRLVVLLVRVQY